VMRVPMQGRTRAVIGFSRDESQDMSIQILGRRAGTRAQLIEFTTVVASSEGVVTWFTDGAPPAGYAGNPAAKQVNVENETYDELLIYAWGDAGGTGGVYFMAEAFGEQGNL